VRSSRRTPALTPAEVHLDANTGDARSARTGWVREAVPEVIPKATAFWAVIHNFAAGRLDPVPAS
jgi:hypothetical protein